MIYNGRSNETTVFPSLHMHCPSFFASLIAVYKFCHSVGLQLDSVVTVLHMLMDIDFQSRNYRLPMSALENLKLKTRS